MAEARSAVGGSPASARLALFQHQPTSLFKPVSLNIGLRYAASRRSFISFISIIAVSGMVLSVAVLVLIISVMNGFERELQQRLLGVLPHISLYGRDSLSDWRRIAERLEKDTSVLGVSPFIQGSGLLAVPENVAGVVFNGVDPKYLNKTSDLQIYMQNGGVSDLIAGEFGILLGKQTARDLKVKVGETVTVVLPEANVTPVGIYPRQKRSTLRVFLRPLPNWIIEPRMFILTTPQSSSEFLLVCRVSR